MSTLQNFIETQRETHPILLMTHVIYGYPTVAESLTMMDTLLHKGVAILEVQFPFTDPVADGPVIADACHVALQNDPQLGQCLKDVNELAANYPQSKVLLVSYLNPLLQYGFKQLRIDMAPMIAGVIIPDLPVDQKLLLQPLVDTSSPGAIDPIWLIIPNMQASRIALVCSSGQGMLYCVSRKGVTGRGGSQSERAQLQSYLSEIKRHTQLPLALGFGISSADDIKSIVGLVDIAVVGSALLRAYQTGGIEQFSAKVDELLAA